MNVLLIENNNETARAVKQALKDQNYVLTHLKSSGEIIERLRNGKENPELVIIGIGDLDSDPVRLVKDIRAIKPLVPIVITFPINQKGEAPDILKSDAQAAVVDPVEQDLLLATIEAQFRLKNRISNKLVSGNLELDLRRQIIKVNEKRIHMTKIEFQILRVLIENNGRVISREELTQKVWHLQGDEIFSNVIDVHIRRLRKKIGDTDKKIITAIRGKGYCYNET